MFFIHGPIKPLGVTERPIKGTILEGRSRDLHKELTSGKRYIARREVRSKEAGASKT